MIHFIIPGLKAGASHRSNSKQIIGQMIPALISFIIFKEVMDF